MGGLAFFANGTSNARGVALLIKKGTPIMIDRVETDNSGRILACDLVNVNNMENKFSIITLYAPNSDDPDFFHQLVKKTVDCCSNKIIIGDYNMVLDATLDRKNTKEFKHLSREVLLAAIKEWNWVDIWRVRNEKTKFYTWEITRPTHKASRIDFS